MNKHIYIVILLLVYSISVHSNEEKYQELIERINTVNELIQKATLANSLWRDTKDLTSKARKQAETNNFAQANELITEAEFQVKQGIQQSSEQPDINNLIPYYLQH